MSVDKKKMLDRQQDPLHGNSFSDSDKNL